MPSFLTLASLRAPPSPRQATRMLHSPATHLRTLASRGETVCSILAERAEFGLKVNETVLQAMVVEVSGQIDLIGFFFFFWLFLFLIFVIVWVA